MKEKKSLRERFIEFGEWICEVCFVAVVTIIVVIILNVFFEL